MVRSDRFWILNGTRDKLIDILDGSWSAEVHSRPIPDVNFIDLPRGQLAFTWTQRPKGTGLPQLIVGREEDTDDLLSWASTYVRALGPLTAHCRIITPNSLSLITANNCGRYWDLTGLDKACAGIIIGEVSALSRRVISVDDISVAACHSTLSFSLLQASESPLGEIDLEKIPESWMRARQIIEKKDQLDDALHVYDAFRALAKVNAPDSTDDIIVKALKSLAKDGRPPTDVLHLISNEEFDALQRNGGFGALSAEDRVRIYDVVSEFLAHRSSFPLRERSFFIALLAMMCRPGAFDAMGLLAPYVSQYPQAALWYGLMQGLVPKNDALVCGNGLGWRIVRDLQVKDDLLGRPRCDISLRELEIFGRSRSRVRPIKSETKSRLWVELLPGVRSLFRVPDLSKPASELAPPLPLFGGAIEQIATQQRDRASEALHELERALGKCMDIIRHAIDENPQADSEPPTRKRRRKAT